MSRVETRLKELGFELPAPGASAKFDLVVQAGRLLFLSGHGPEVNGKPFVTGQLGAEVDVDTGYRAAQICGLNCLASLKQYLGDLDRVERVVKVLGFVNSAPGFSQQPAVVNGFTDLMVQVFGEAAGRHARSAVGMAGLPGNIPVEVEMIVSIRE